MKKLFTAIATLLAAGMTVAAVSAVELEKVESSTEFSARETAEVRSTFNAENELTLVFFENFDDMETGEKNKRLQFFEYVSFDRKCRFQLAKQKIELPVLDGR